MTQERRRRQRFVASRRGEPCFWITINGSRVNLLDLSIDGCGLVNCCHLRKGETFDFVLSRKGVPDSIMGTGRVVSEMLGEDGSVIGVLFEILEDDGRMRLADWLTAHVLASASVPISENDAELIVKGPPLI